MKLNNLLDKLRNGINSINSTIDGFIQKHYEMSGFAFNKEIIKLLLRASIIASLCLILLTPVLNFLSNILSLLTLSLSAMFILASLCLIIYVVHLVSRRRTIFNERFLYTLSNIVPLIAAGLPLDEVLRHLYIFEKDPVIRREVELILKDVSLGQDIITALQSSISRVPSTVYNDVMSTLIESIKLSQEPSSVLVTKLDSLVRSKLLRFRQVTTFMTMIFQTYVTLSFLVPCIVLIMFVVLSSLQTFQMGPCIFDAVGLSIILLIFYTPLVAYIFYVIFDLITSAL